MNQEQLEKSLDRISEWIRASDQKVSIFLAFQALVLTQILPFGYKIVSNFYFLYHQYSLILIILGIFYLIFGVLIAGFSVIPNLKSIFHKSGSNQKKSLLYFNDISSMKFESYKEKIKDLTKEEYEDSLIQQIYVLSGIATKKHQQSTESVTAFLLGILLLLVWILITI